MQLAASIVLFFVVQWATAALGFAIGVPITPLPLFFGLMSAIFFLRRSIPTLLLFLILTFSSIGLTAAFQDYSWDGNSYHREAVINLVLGWDPFRQVSPSDSQYAEWLAYFTKGPWYSEASILTTFGEMNPVKYGAILMAFPPALLFAEVLRKRLRRQAPDDPEKDTPSRWMVVLLATLFAFSPVVLYQLFTKYVDGQVGALVGVLICTLLLAPDEEERNRGLPANLTWYLLLGCTVIMLINIKLTGGLYAALLIGGYLLFELIRRQFDRRAWIVAAAAGLIGIGIGWNPFVTQYLTNTVAHASPFYPTNYSDLTHIEVNIPDYMKGKGYLEKALISLFSASESDTHHPYELKVPLNVTLRELGQFYSPDMRYAGFGPWFSAILILAVLVFLINIRHTPPALIVLLALLGLTIFINPELWWARYVPQAWLVPVMIVAFARPVGKWPLVNRALLFLLTGNTLMVAFAAIIPQVLHSLLPGLLPK